MSEEREYLRARDIARLTGLSLRTARRLIADEIVPSVKVRGARLVPRKGLERVLSPAPMDGLGGAEELEEDECRVRDEVPADRNRSMSKDMSRNLWNKLSRHRGRLALTWNRRRFSGVRLRV